MERFGEKPNAFFNNVYRQDVPWEIGGIQPDLLNIIKAFPPEGRILDIGCGSGDTTIDIARLGFEVVGVDFVEKAIDNARLKASANKNLKVSFICGDGLKPSCFGKDFGGVIDSGFLHLFDDEELYGYVEDLSIALKPNGLLYLIEFAIQFDMPNTPRAVTPKTIEKLFEGRKWEIIRMQECSFLNKVSPVLAIMACVKRKN